MAPLIGLGLSLLPKIPAMWSGIASLFGKKAPSGVEAAGELADEIIAGFKKGQIPPEVQAKLEEEMMKHEQEMSRIALEEKKLDYKDFDKTRELEIESYKSEDEYVRRTRPMMLRSLFYLCAAYVLYAPLAIIGSSYAGLDMSMVLDMIQSNASWLFGTFSVSFLGYAGARTIDKRNPGGVIGNLASKIVGRKR